MSNAGTPDWQRGVVNAQKLLATVPEATLEMTVGVPPNAETIIVLIKTVTATTVVEMTGVTSGVDYANITGFHGPVEGEWRTYVFDAVSVLDEQATVTLSHEPEHDWYIYSDAGVHVVFDPLTGQTIGNNGGIFPEYSQIVGGRYGGQPGGEPVEPVPLAASAHGDLYVIGTLPGPGSKDHPRVELQLAVVDNATTDQTLVAAPPAGSRIRLLWAEIALLSSETTGEVLLIWGATKTLRLVHAGPASRVLDCKPSGIPLPEHTALETGLGGIVHYSAQVIYTVEEI